MDLEHDSHIEYSAGIYRIAETLNGKLKDAPAYGWLPEETRREVDNLAKAMYRAGFIKARERLSTLSIEMIADEPKNPYANDTRNWSLK